MFASRFFRLELIGEAIVARESDTASDARHLQPVSEGENAVRAARETHRA